MFDFARSLAIWLVSLRVEKNKFISSMENSIFGPIFWKIELKDC